ncbi:type VI secretion system protein ImpG [Acinetobacter sp. ANC 4558]|uniref:type VI secretion system baseplate subunit TssF n=1 Tax=Acinetobacter sp. ANC 4558 TaxID=1977876 RepID=UPI000A341735|nr:type VI secretion system baseplate subunit TssF [Acinetobacter sp. ANC 4558]OTG86382.1 type VI secretion system protein ImpG [Acinetobacter sp. ANC 4558]
MIEELLPFYEKQLQEFGIQAREFSQKYPKIAQRLSLNQEQIDDPHIERLIQSFSLIAAKIDKKLADSYDIFTRAIFEVMFPQYLKHFPSCTVVSFEDINKQKQLVNKHNIPKETYLKSRSFKGVQCIFKTSTDVDLLPIQLKDVSFKTNPSSLMHLNKNATLSFKFEIFNAAQTWMQHEKLTIYLDAIANFPLQVLDGIFKADSSFSFVQNNFSSEIKNPFTVKGFAESEALLPIDQHTHHAYRLLLEYFCFPEKFNYLDLNLSFLKQLKEDQTEFEIQIHLKLNLNDQSIIRNYSELNTANFKLFTTPVVNLFEKKAEPQKINHKQLEYPLITDTHHPEFYQVYSITNMHMIREKSEDNQVSYPVVPFFAMSHYYGENVKFFYALNPILYQSKYTDTGYSIISKNLEPHQLKSDFISTTLQCSNGDLPHEALSITNNILSLNDTTIARRALVLKRPTIPAFFEQNKKEQWRIISHLSLNTLALMNDNAISHIKELLELYNITKIKENHLVIDSIKKVDFSLTHKMVEAKPFPLFVRGIKVIVRINSQVFRGHSLYIYSMLLSHVFNLKVQMNSFVDVSIIDSQTDQEVYQCVQNVGGKKLL